MSNFLPVVEKEQKNVYMSAIHNNINITSLFPIFYNVANSYIFCVI